MNGNHNQSGNFITQQHSSKLNCEQDKAMNLVGKVVIDWKLNHLFFYMLLLLLQSSRSHLVRQRPMPVSIAVCPVRCSTNRTVHCRRFTGILVALHRIEGWIRDLCEWTMEFEGEIQWMGGHRYSKRKLAGHQVPCRSWWMLVEVLNNDDHQ